ncbi:hypothetical protein AKG08_11635 [Achromobacter piechaudii]|uniref:DUF2846 domain-containing protein n=1 Tax=Achromobacter piechaudii TaxID=72556 RepID=UPI0006816D17|nr:DUF2846 domain-containing protein [Achromobacter piechaudii]KNY10356.1 hypothetical protein AKG08_11635 [Achromobacter piechaudii]
MKTVFRLLLAAAGSLLLLAGCAGPRYADISSNIRDLEPGSGRLYFYQPGSADSAEAVRPVIMVDGRKVGRSSPGRFFFVDRPAGTRTLIIAADRKDPDAALKAELPAGQSIYVRVELVDGKPVLRLEDSAESATQALAGLHYWGAGRRERQQLRY